MRVSYLLGSRIREINIYTFQPLWEGVELQALVCGVVPHSGATQRGEIRSAVERSADVASEGSDISAFAAFYTQGDVWHIVVEQLDLLYGESLGFEVHFLSAACQVVGSCAANFAFVSGCLACTWMIALVKKCKLIYFALYCAVVGLAVLIINAL